MPTPSSVPAGPRLSRRAALAGAAAVAGAAVTGCTVDDRPRGSDPGRTGAPSTGPTEATVDPDVATATEALRVEQETVDLLGATARRHPRLAARVAAPLAAHEAHVALLDEAAPSSPALAGPGSSSPGTSASSSPAPGAGRRTPIPRNRTRALRDLVDAETRLSAALRDLALTAESGALARVLGSMAASAAQHAAVLAGQVRG